MMLNMNSAPMSAAAMPPSSPADRAPRSPDDRTGRARIRDAALRRFGDDGVDGTSLRVIAENAEVSPALVVHHFGSKAGLVRACDEHVVDSTRRAKEQAMAAGAGLDAMGSLREAASSRPLLRYLARRLVDHSPQVATLVDELVTDAQAYLATGEDTGMIRPTADPWGRAAVLTIWSLGALVLHEHVARLLGADLTEDTAGLVAYSRPAVEVLGSGVFTPDIAARLLRAYDVLDDPTQPVASPQERPPSSGADPPP